MLHHCSDVTAEGPEQRRLQQRIGDQALLPDVVEAGVRSRLIDHRFVALTVVVHQLDAGVGEVHDPGDW